MIGLFLVFLTFFMSVYVTYKDSYDKKQFVTYTGHMKQSNNLKSPPFDSGGGPHIKTAGAKDRFAQ
jgi:hypothetical protein